ncbi:hypothetical protein FDA94_20200 [Herbidospora galbida]|uniref:Uncharacterized protein n=1 Tax=Herbidospora galbida TaxID=2575442 RepID=A0A4U3MEH7_9ACTN|nr:hypothetical protein [Herbidospora galbida]TKK86782.1 hypothetical protein FDA94_20200 [Herbidospora galbida]
MTRLRLFVGDLLILVTFLGALTGESYFLPFGGEVVHRGSYAPLQNVPHVVDHAPTVSVDIWAFDLDRGGILFYGLILWTAMGRYLHGAAAFALAVVTTVTAVLLHVDGVWYVPHLLATAGLGAVLADASRRERTSAAPIRSAVPRRRPATSLP